LIEDQTMPVIAMTQEIEGDDQFEALCFGQAPAREVSLRKLTAVNDRGSHGFLC
jgi:hypothetical protein